MKQADPLNRQSPAKLHDAVTKKFRLSGIPIAIGYCVLFFVWLISESPRPMGRTAELKDPSQPLGKKQRVNLHDFDSQAYMLDVPELVR